MFSLRDQENIVHARETTAASKPLNQGLRQPHLRPAGNPRTPFHSARHDENKIFTLQQQKTVVQQGPSKAKSTAFATPAGPKSRAPLGAKTTNAKSHALKTPAVGQATQQEKTHRKLSTARRSARKIAVAAEVDQNHTKENEIQDEEPDFGYAPPPIVELPDPPMEFDYDQNVEDYKPEDMLRDYGKIYFGSPTDENGISIRAKQEEEKVKQYRKDQEQQIMEGILQRQSMRSDPDAEVDAMIAAGPRTRHRDQTREANVNTINARLAATTLGGSSMKAPSVASKQTISSSQKSNHGKKVLRSQPFNFGGTAPRSVSKNTIGFPRAKQPPSIVPTVNQDNAHRSTNIRPLKSKEVHPVEFVKLYGEPPMDSEMWFRLKQHELLEQEPDTLFDEDLDSVDTELSLFNPGFEMSADDFQLPMPED